MAEELELPVSIGVQIDFDEKFIKIDLDANLCACLLILEREAGWDISHFIAVLVSEGIVQNAYANCPLPENQQN